MVVMDMQPIAMQLFGTALTIIGGLILNRVKQQARLQEENNAALKRLEILFEVKMSAYDEKLKDHDSKITFLQTKTPRR